MKIKVKKVDWLDEQEGIKVGDIFEVVKMNVVDCAINLKNRYGNKKTTEKLFQFISIKRYSPGKLWNLFVTLNPDPEWFFADIVKVMC